MGAEGINDLKSDDLRALWKMRRRIEEEKKSIEKTLQEIKNRLKKE
jgi:uridine kinase